MPAQPSPSRMEAFSDGVIAVIITIMVLDFKVPRLNGLPGFLTILPTLVIYLLSFTLTGIYWINHHHMVDRLKRVDALILWCNLGFLFCLSLLPFCTAYLLEKHLDPFSVSVYAASLLLDGVAFTLLNRAIVRHMHHSADHLYDNAIADEQIADGKKGTISIAVYLTSILLAQWHPYLALTLIALVAFLWIVPSFRLDSVRGPAVPPASA